MFTLDIIGYIRFMLEKMGSGYEGRPQDRLCCGDPGAVELRFPPVTLLVLDY